MTGSPTPPLPARANVLGVGVHGVNMDTAVAAIEHAAHDRRKGCVCVTGVHGVSESQHDEALRHIHNRAFLVVPDGMPMVWVGRAQGLRDMRRVYGPDLMLEICRRSVADGTRHFLYGGREGVARSWQTASARSSPASGSPVPTARPSAPSTRPRSRILCNASPVPARITSGSA